MFYFQSRILTASAIALGVLVLTSRSNVVTTTQEPRELYTRSEVGGSLSGRILFDGQAPPRRKIDESQDRHCAEIARNPRMEDLIVTNGRVANVFLYLKGKPLGKYRFEAPTSAAVIDQRECRFVPHVIGIQTNQTLLIFNSDPTTHNVHPAPKVNVEWNQMLSQGAPPIEKKFPRQEAMIPIKCNQHPWMRAYVGVIEHPFFAVSRRDGTFEISGLPAGTYTLVAWHETLGEQEKNVTVDANRLTSVEFAFSAAGRSASSALPKIERPIVIE